MLSHVMVVAAPSTKKERSLPLSEPSRRLLMSMQPYICVHIRMHTVRTVECDMYKMIRKYSI